DATAVQVCAGDGLSWVAQPACDRGCANGACVQPPLGCPAGATRCAGSGVQKCDGTQWVEVADCLSGCSGGACSGGAGRRGAAGGVRVPGPWCPGGVGGAGCAGAAVALPPADGASTVLAIAEPLIGLDGTPVPDGTPVTIAATGGAALLSPDIDAAPGIQIR